LNVKVKDQGHQGQKCAVHYRHPWQQWNGTHSLHAAADGTIPSLLGVISAGCMWLMFGKTS